MAIEVFPNPVSQVLNLSFDLQEVSKQTEVKLVSMEGKIIDHQIYTSIQNQQVSMNISTYTPGNYLLMITTDQGLKTKQITIAR